jgi:hypothetical protein
MDSYWTGLAEFLDSAAETAGVSLAPRAVAAAIPGLTPFDKWDHLQMIGRMIVHKGMVDEIPSALLAELFGTARPSFANEVFVVYDITPAADEHVRAAQLALAEKAAFPNMPDNGKAADPTFVGISDLDESMPFEQQFEQFFRPRLGKRADGFAKLFAALAARPAPLIIETGCLRTPDNWEGDGQSSFIFDALVRERHGKFLSIDASVDSIATARRACSSAANFICNDSVSALHSLSQLVRGPADLLYFDSFDVDPANPLPSAIHHAMELTAAGPLGGSGTIVCVDDYGVASGPGGKGLILDMFFNRIHADVLHAGYQKIWRLP